MPRRRWPRRCRACRAWVGTGRCDEECDTTDDGYAVGGTAPAPGRRCCPRLWLIETASAARVSGLDIPGPQLVKQRRRLCSSRGGSRRFVRRSGCGGAGSRGGCRRVGCRGRVAPGGVGRRRRGDRLVQPADPGQPFGQSPRSQPRTRLVHQVGVMMVLGPVITHENHRLRSLPPTDPLSAGLSVEPCRAGEHLAAA
jgi:hypothetical protein